VKTRVVVLFVFEEVWGLLKVESDNWVHSVVFPNSY